MGRSKQSIEDTVTCPFDPESSVVAVMRLKRKQILLKLERFLSLSGDRGRWSSIWRPNLSNSISSFAPTRIKR